LQKSPHIREFSKHFLQYEKYSFLQKKVAKHLLSKINHDKKNILDLGCGNGLVYSHIKCDYDKFIALDFSNKMLQIHPKNDKVKLVEKNFDDLDGDFFKSFDLVISSSSLQWSKDITKIIKNIQENSKDFALAVFCDKTFKDLRNWLEIDTFLPSSDEIVSVLHNYTTYEKKIYKIEFRDVISQLRYIKKSGVSGGVKKLSVKKLRDFIKNYDKKELEFEVLFIWSKTL